MTLTDTGPLVALVNRNDPHHAKCMETLKQLPTGPLITTWPCFTEAMYLLFRAVGFAGQLALWTMLGAGRLALRDLTAEEIDRMAEMMEKYRDKPMDLADASLVATAEKFGTKRIFSLDSDFYVYRLADGTALEVVP